MEELIEKYKEFLQKEVDMNAKYLDNLVRRKMKYELKNNPNLKEVSIVPEETTDPNYTKCRFDRINSARIILDYFNDEKNSLFIWFEDLGITLQNSNFKTQEQIGIIQYVIIKNALLFKIKTNILAFDTDKIKKTKFKYITHEELDELIDSNGVIKFLKKKNYFNMKLLRKQLELGRLLPDLIEDLSPLKETCESIYDNFINVEELTNTGVEIFINGLEKLEIPKELCERIKVYLLRQIVKKEIPKDKNYHFNFEVNIDKNSLKPEDVRKMTGELNKVFDFNKNEFKIDITYSEVLYYVSLMKKLGYEENIIRNFLKKYEENSGNKEAITRYLELKEKLEYYKEKYGLKEQLENIEEYYNEVQKLDKDSSSYEESYEYWQDAINEELNKALSFIPRSFEYELKD